MFGVGGFHEQVWIVPFKFEGWFWLPGLIYVNGEVERATEEKKTHLKEQRCDMILERWLRSRDLQTSTRLSRARTGRGVISYYT